MDLTEETDEYIQQLLGDVYAEVQRRAVLASAPAEADALAERYAEASGRQDGDDWSQPTGAHDSYPTGAIVTHDGQTWESATSTNIWQPGTDHGHAWRLVQPESEGPLPWTYPVDYKVGDRVTYSGRLYECKLAHMSASNWQPPVAHGNWTDIGPA